MTIVSLGLGLILGAALGFQMGQTQAEQTQPPAAPSPTAQTQGDENDEGVLGTLWVQTAAEYQVSSEQVYKSAREQLDQALADTQWTAAVEQKTVNPSAPPAIILDVDETVLDNSPFQAKLLIDDATYTPELWGQWVQKKSAIPVPGAVDFLTYAKEKGVTIFYVTNREKSEEEATRDNLTTKGFPLDTATDVLLTQDEKPDWTSDKTSRRAAIAQNYRILLLFGDDLNDFVAGAKKKPNGDLVKPEERVALAERYQENWGSKWFMLPNPQYGSWERALDGQEKEALKPFQ